MQLSLSPRLRRSHFYGFVTRTLSFGNVLRRVLDALYAFREHKRQMLMGLGWTFCGHALLAGMMLATGIVLIPEAPVQIIPFLSLLGSLANAIPITPGGMGVGEAATEKLYGLAGFSGGAALILTWRLSTLPLCVIGAIVSMVGLKRRSLAMQAHKEEAVSTHTVPTE
jgi:uncharacterized membrane protein YbhN (UPF0104 family)